jgi:hypothetical protein
MLQLVYLAGLVAIAILYFTDVIKPRHFVGSVPIAVPWFGALGGALISMTGVFEHTADWLPSYRYWHWSRPIVGAAVGMISVLIFQAGILAVGEDVQPSGTSPSKNLLYYLIAFFVGYREQAFREMMKRLGDVILVHGVAGGGVPTVTSVDPESVPHSSGGDVIVEGTGLDRVLSVKFGEEEATKFGVVSDIHISATAPPAGEPGAVTLLVIFRDGSALGHSFTYT